MLESELFLSRPLLRLQETKCIILTGKCIYRIHYFYEILQILQDSFGAEEKRELTVLNYKKWKEIHYCFYEYFCLSCH